MINAKFETMNDLVKHAIQIHTDIDEDLAIVLPATLIGLRMTANKGSSTSPFILVHHFQANLPILGSSPDT